MSTPIIGPAAGVQTVAPDELRVNTRSAFDFVYWAGKFIASGTPDSYETPGFETDGVPLIVWALGQVNVGFPETYELAVDHLANSQMTVAQALRTRGALLVCYNRISISVGLDNVIDVINGRHFMYKSVFSPQTPNTCRRIWQYGAYVPGLIY